MRLIDADKIPYVEAVKDTLEPSGEFYARREDICAMPTIEPELEKGKWIKHEHGFWSYVNEHGERDGWTPDYECSQCGSRGWQVIECMNFCPQCGADMRGE